MFCNKCGSQLPEGAAACPNCGTQVEQKASSASAPNPTGQPVQQMNNSFQSQPQSFRQSIAQAKLGVSCGVLAALLSFSGALGWSIVFALIAGYIFLFESDQWLKSYTANVTKIFVIYNLVSLAISLVKTCLSIFTDVNIFSINFVSVMYKVSSGFSVIGSIANIVFIVILLVNAVNAYNMRNN